MSLHNGIDTVAFISFGWYSKTYGASAQKALCNLYASFGLLEDAPNVVLLGIPLIMYHRMQLEREG